MATNKIPDVEMLTEQEQQQKFYENQVNAKVQAVHDYYQNIEGKLTTCYNDLERSNNITNDLRLQLSRLEEDLKTSGKISQDFADEASRLLNELTTARQTNLTLRQNIDKLQIELQQNLNKEQTSAQLKLENAEIKNKIDTLMGTISQLTQSNKEFQEKINTMITRCMSISGSEVGRGSSKGGGGGGGSVTTSGNKRNRRFDSDDDDDEDDNEHGNAAKRNPTVKMRRRIAQPASTTTAAASVTSVGVVGPSMPILDFNDEVEMEQQQQQQQQQQNRPPSISSRNGSRRSDSRNEYRKPTTSNASPMPILDLQQNAGASTSFQQPQTPTVNPQQPQFQSQPQIPIADVPQQRERIDNQIRNLYALAPNTFQTQKSHINLLRKYGYDIETLTESQVLKLVQKMRQSNKSDSYISTVITTIRHLRKDLNVNGQQFSLKRNNTRKIMSKALIDAIKNLIIDSVEFIKNGTITETNIEADVYLAVVLVFLTNLRINEVLQLTRQNLTDIYENRQVNIKIKKRSKPMQILKLDLLFKNLYPQLLRFADNYQRFDRLIKSDPSNMNKLIKQKIIGETGEENKQMGLKIIRIFNTTQMINDGEVDLARVFNRHRDVQTTVENYNYPLEPINNLNDIINTLGIT